MLNVRPILAGLLATATFSGNALAKAPAELNGLWILDAAATEQLFSGSPLPPNANTLAEGFMIAGGYMCMISYQFSYDTVTRDAYGGNGRRTEYRLLSEQDTVLTYTKTNPTAGPEPETLPVSVVRSGSLEIADPLMGLPMLWKKSPVTNDRVKRDDITAACNTWFKSMERIMNRLKGRPN